MDQHRRPESRSKHKGSHPKKPVVHHDSPEIWPSGSFSDFLHLNSANPKKKKTKKKRPAARRIRTVSALSARHAPVKASLPSARAWVSPIHCFWTKKLRLSNISKTTFWVQGASRSTLTTWLLPNELAMPKTGEFFQTLCPAFLQRWLFRNKKPLSELLVRKATAIWCQKRWSKVPFSNKQQFDIKKTIPR